MILESGSASIGKVIPPIGERLENLYAIVAYRCHFQAGLFELSLFCLQFRELCFTPRSPVRRAYKKQHQAFRAPQRMSVCNFPFWSRASKAGTFCPTSGPVFIPDTCAAAMVTANHAMLRAFIMLLTKIGRCATGARRRMILFSQSTEDK